MTEFNAELAWIDAQDAALRDRLIQWALINSGSHHLEGLAKQCDALEEAFAPLGGAMQRRRLAPQKIVDEAGNVTQQPLGEALWIAKRPEAARQVCLCIHMDTVYGPDHPFQTVEQLSDDRLRGPGVADAKGGLLVMLTALQALERSPFAQHIGWQVLINPDEEIGSPGSDPLIRKAAQGCDVGLVFEPALPDGSLIASRKGSGNYTVVVRGRSAHAGRDFDKGRNAVTAMAELVTALSALSGARPGLTVNVANVRGGGPSNIVPDLAIVRFNVRLWQREDQAYIEDEIARLVRRCGERDGITAALHGGFTAPPKPLDDATERLLEAIGRCGSDLGMSLRWRESGGVCDGNRLAAAGLPTVDTLGVVGGAIHSSDEYVLLDSITQRAKLTALLLLRFAAGRIDWPKRTL